ncbi:MAG: hypothetical protein ACK559_12230, partial [bacterium]
MSDDFVVEAAERPGPASNSRTGDLARPGRRAGRLLIRRTVPPCCRTGTPCRRTVTPCRRTGTPCRRASPAPCQGQAVVALGK